MFSINLNPVSYADKPRFNKYLQLHKAYRPSHMFHFFAASSCSSEHITGNYHFSSVPFSLVVMAMYKRALIIECRLWRCRRGMVYSDQDEATTTTMTLTASIWVVCCSRKMAPTAVVCGTAPFELNCVESRLLPATCGSAQPTTNDINSRNSEDSSYSHTCR